MFIELLLFVISAGVCFFLWQRHAHAYWQRHNVKFIRPHAVFGNLSDLLLLRKSFPIQFDSLYNDASLKGDEPVVGIYNCFRPALVLRDMALAKRILIKDFNEFPNRSTKPDPHHDPLGANNLFLARHANWRELRPKLSPVFTSGKIKQMFPLMTEVGRELQSLLLTISSGSTVNMKEISNRFTNEMISTIAFGIRASSLRDPTNSFYRHSLAMFEGTLKRALDFAIVLLLPTLTSLLRVKFFSAKASNFMRREITHILADRERTGLKRNDLIDTLVAMKQEAQAQPDKQNPARDIDYLVAQATLFQSAGYETSATTITYTLYELALQPALQERLRAEIQHAYDESTNEVVYERLQALTYLGQVVDETLRKYPVAGVIERECTPVSGKEGYSLAPYSDFVVPPGMGVYVPVNAVHHDKRYWSEPAKYDPERFAPENRKNLNMDAYLPFGAGPRNCLGLRIGLLQAKLGLVYLLKNHRVEPCEKTQKVIEFDARTVFLSSKPDIHLKLIRVES